MTIATWIVRWNEAAAHWSVAIWRSCWQGGLFALLAWLICRRLRRIPAAACYGLWWLVCLKLVVGMCPLFLPLPLLPAMSQPPPVAETSPVVALPLAATLASPTPPAQPHVPIRWTAGTRPVLSNVAWLMAGWLIVTGTLLGLSIVSLRRLLKLVRQAKPLSDPALLLIAQEAATAMALRRMPRILVTPADAGILTLGVWRPVVLLSQQSLTCCSSSELRLVLGHEFAHIRRRDAWTGLLPHLMQILFWFHPLAWLACREIDLAREAACDEQTLSALQVRSELYGRLLLKLGGRHTSWSSLCTPGVSSRFRMMQRRLAMLQQIRERSPRRQGGHQIALVCLIGAAIAAPWSLVHAQHPEPNTSMPNTSIEAPPTHAERGVDAARAYRQQDAAGNGQNGNTNIAATLVRQPAHTVSQSTTPDKTAAFAANRNILVPDPQKQIGETTIIVPSENRTVTANKASNAATPTLVTAAGRRATITRRAVPAQLDSEQRAEMRLVTINAKKTLLLAVVDELMKQAHVNYTLDSQLQNAPIGAIRLTKVPFRTALDIILKASGAGATYQVEGGVYMIVTRVESPSSSSEPVQNNRVSGAGQAASTSEPDVSITHGNMPDEPHVKLSVQNCDLATTLSLMFTRANIQYTLDPAVRNVTVTANIDQPLRIALETLLRAGGNHLTYRVENDIYAIIPKTKGDGTE
jgi:beta-lactamase regulating signal transducer with metallopeptidase domain